MSELGRRFVGLVSDDGFTDDASPASDRARGSVDGNHLLLIVAHLDSAGPISPDKQLAESPWL